MHILVTGATGFLGSYITRLLLKNNHDVTAIFRASSSFDLIEDCKSSIHWVESDLLEVATLESAFQNIDLIVHAGAMVNFGTKNIDLLNRINIEGTANVVNLALEYKVPKLIYISSVAALDRSKDELFIDESFDFKESQWSTDYGKSKHHGELEAWRGMAEGLEVTVLNPSLIFGGGFWDVGSAQLFKQVYSNNKFYPSGGMGVVDVRDVAQAVINAINQFHNGSKYVISGHNTSFKEIYQLLSKAWNLSEPKYEIKGILKGLAFGFLKFKSILNYKSSALSKKTFNNLFRNYKYNNQKSKEYLQLEYRSLKETVEDCCNAYMSSLKEGSSFKICPF